MRRKEIDKQRGKMRQKILFVAKRKSERKGQSEGKEICSDEEESEGKRLIRMKSKGK